MSMRVSPSPTHWSTVAALPDYLLLAQTRQLARHEQALQILVLDHLREIEARRLHLTRGYGSLFDYVVHELGYTAAAAWRRIKAMRLCSQTSGARELLQDGSLNLSNAAQLQNLFERSDRGHGRPPGGAGAGGGLGGAPRSGGAPGEPASAAPVRAGERDPAPPEAGPAPAAAPVLDAAAREELVRQAAGKSTREVQQMLAEVDPELAQPSDRMRALAGGRWELKAAVDAECRHGLEKLQMLLSHRDPHLTLGGLVARLVRDGLHRYDPARPPRPRRTDGRGSVERAQSARQPARRNTKALQRSVVRANGSDVERPREDERDDTSLAADRDGLPGASAANRSTEAERGGASAAAAANGGHTTSAPKRKSQAELGRPPRAAAPDGGGRAASAAKRGTGAERGGANSAAVRGVSRGPESAAKRPSKAEHGSASPVAAPDSDGYPALPAERRSKADHGSASLVAAPNRDGHPTSSAKCQSEAELGRAERAAAGDGGGLAVASPKRDAEAERGGAKYTPAANVGGRAASPAKRRGQSSGAGRDARVGGGLDRTMGASGARFEADRRDAAPAPGRGGTRFPTSAAERLAYAAGHGSGVPAERSPALQRHLAALRCCGAVPGSRSRYIPAVVRREVWRRDQGRCSYVDRHSGRRCGSRYRLEIDHIVPFALGGGAEPRNLTLHCRAHHRLRHAQRHGYADSVPPEARRARVFAVGPQEQGQTVGSHAAIDRAGT